MQHDQKTAWDELWNEFEKTMADTHHGDTAIAMLMVAHKLGGLEHQLASIHSLLESLERRVPRVGP